MEYYVLPPPKINEPGEFAQASKRAAKKTKELRQVEQNLLDFKLVDSMVRERAKLLRKERGFSILAVREVVQCVLEEDVRRLQIGLIQHKKPIGPSPRPSRYFLPKK